MVQLELPYSLEKRIGFALSAVLASPVGFHWPCPGVLLLSAQAHGRSRRRRPAHTTVVVLKDFTV